MDIISLPIEMDKEKIDSRFRLVVISSQRAMELSKGIKPRILTKDKKITTNAILESVSGEVDFLTGDEARITHQKAEKLDFKKWVSEKKRHMEDLTDLEKDLKVYLHEKESAEKILDYLSVDEKEVEETEDLQEPAENSEE